MKKQMMLSLLAVLALSILPGCGKSKNDKGGGVIGGGGVIVAPPVTGGGSGGCYNTSTLFNSGLTLGFSGTASLGTGIRAQMPLYSHSGGIPGGYTNSYYRDLFTGDRIDIAINGTNAYAQVTLSPNTIAWINTYGGGQICGFYVDATIHSVMYGKSNGGYDGNFGGGAVGVYTAGSFRYL
jgi:hypothetical protein